MTDDIVTRLHCAYGNPVGCGICTFCLAKDEIERLRADNLTWRTIADKLADEVDAQILDTGLELYREAIKNERLQR